MAVVLACEHRGYELTESSARSSLSFSEKAAIELTAAYLSDLSVRYETEGSLALFLAYSASQRPHHRRRSSRLSTRA